MFLSGHLHPNAGGWSRIIVNVGPFCGTHLFPTFLVEELAHFGCDLEESIAKNPAIQPGTGFTTKPGVAGLRRTPGTGPRNVQNPDGVPQHGHHSLIKYCSSSELWNPVGVRIARQIFLGCAVVMATPGFVVKSRWG